MKYIYSVSIILLVIWIFSLFFSIAAVSEIFFHEQIYFHIDDFKKEKVYIDTLQTLGSSKDGKYMTYVGYTNSNKFTVLFFDGRKTGEEIASFEEEYEKNNKYLNIWVSPNSKYAYFDLPVLNTTTQLQLWYQPLTEIFIFILITLILIRWSKYFKKELSKYGLTTSEFHKLRKERKLDQYLKNYENN